MNQIGQPQPGGEMVLLEGVISELEVSAGRENLLERVNRNYRIQSAVTGVGAVVGDLFGQAAAAASLAMYEGEDTENFVCLFDGRLMCGTFGGASKLPLGRPVKAVVEARDDVLIARAIMSESDGLVWLTHAWGSKAERRSNLKIAWWAFWFQLVCAVVAGWAILGVGTEDFWLLMQASVVGMGLLLPAVALWNSRTMGALADPATEIFRKLGFADPEYVNLNSYQYGLVHLHELVHSNESRANHANIHCYKKAIADGKLKLAQ